MVGRDDWKLEINRMVAKIVNRVKGSIQRRMRAGGLSFHALPPWNFRAEGGSRPIFVSGVQRSGTNMLMECFERCRNVVVHHDISRRAYTAYRLKDNETIGDIIIRSRVPNVVFKPLLDVGRLPMLLEQFENSALVWLYRDYSDVVASMLRTFPSSREELDDIMAGRCQSWRSECFTEPVLSSIRPLYRPDLERVDVLALTWLARNIFFFESGMSDYRNTVVIGYNRFAEEGGARFGSLAERLGVSCKPNATRHVHAPRKRKESIDIDEGIAEACRAMAGKLEFKDLLSVATGQDGQWGK